MKKIILILLFSPVIAFGASPSRIGTDTTSEASDSVTSWTISHTVPSTGENRCLIAIISRSSNTGPSSVTWNGSAMTNILSLAGVQVGRGSAWYIANPDTGTHNLVYNWAGAVTERGSWSATYQDCAQASPVDVSGQTNQAGGTSASVDLTTTINGDMIILWMLGVSPGANKTDQAGQTRLFSQTTTGPYAAISEEAQTTAGLINTGYTWTGAENDDLYAMAIKYVAPSGGGGGGATTYFSEATSTEILFFVRHLYYLWIVFLLTVLFMIFLYKYIFV